MQENKTCPYGKVGDVLWVRETFNEYYFDEGYGYKADFTDEAIKMLKNTKWKSSLFMPKAACRIFLEITDIRVERLRDISEEDAIKEGIEIIHMAEINVPVYKNYLLKEKLLTTNPIKSLQTLWQSINGKQSLEANPWVWVISFKRIEKPTDFC
jgi:hypothetical protein